MIKIMKTIKAGKIYRAKDFHGIISFFLFLALDLHLALFPFFLIRLPCPKHTLYFNNLTKITTALKKSLFLNNQKIRRLV